jgi:hypothetical protein
MANCNNNSECFILTKQGTLFFHWPLWNYVGKVRQQEGSREEKEKWKDIFLEILEIGDERNKKYL